MPIFRINHTQGELFVHTQVEAAARQWAARKCDVVSVELIMSDDDFRNNGGTLEPVEVEQVALKDMPWVSTFVQLQPVAEMPTRRSSK